MNRTLSHSATQHYSKVLMWVFALSFFVFIEPSPFDIAFCAFLGLAFMRGDLKVQNPIQKFLVIITLFAIVRLLTILAAVDLTASFRFFLITTYLSFTSVGLACLIANQGSGVVKSIFKGLYIGTIVTGIIVLLVKAGVLGFLHETITMYQGTRVRGFFKDPNVLGPTLIPVTLYALWELELHKKLRDRLLPLTVLSFSAMLTLLSFSRGAWLTMLGGIFVFYGIRVLQRGIKKSLPLIAGATITLIFISLVFLVLLLYGGYYEFFLERTTLQSYDNDRFLVHHILLEEVNQNPWGTGPGSTRGFLDSYYDLEGSNNAHNTYLRVAFENGWVGFLTYLWLVLASFIAVKDQILKKDEFAGYAAVFTATMVCVSVSAFTIDTLHWRHFWWILAMVWGLKAYRNLQEKKLITSQNV